MRKILTTFITPRSLYWLKVSIAATVLYFASAESFHNPKEYEYLRHHYNWGIDLLQKGSINLGEAWKNFKKYPTGTGPKITVAVIDTGIDFNHSLLKENIVVTSGVKSVSNFGMDFAQLGHPTKNPVDLHGHGTHVAGIIRMIAPDVKILALKYYNPYATGNDNLYATIEALKYAVDVANVDIINYSGGGPEPSDEEQAVLKRAEAKGILVVAAAGNERSNLDSGKNQYYPANYKLSNIITVMAHNRNITKLPSSNWGAKSVDISAPGDNITSSVPLNQTASMTGTSQATAFVTGVATLVKQQNPQLKAAELKRIILASANRQPTLKGSCISEGMLDAYQAVIFAQRNSISVAQSSQTTEGTPDSATISSPRKTASQ